MSQKLMILTVMLLGLASCSTPKKAIYVEPVISSNDLNSKVDRTANEKVVVQLKEDCFVR